LISVKGRAAPGANVTQERQGKTMLAPEFTTRASDRLERRRAELEQEIRTKLAAAREVAGSEGIDQVIEGGDYASADLIAALDIAEVQRDIVELREVNAARGRLAEGQYGVCIECGVDILPARLEAYPTALRCTDCQAQAELRSGAQHARL
jgi:RNA polymerase-binding transcription factor DksA